MAERPRPLPARRALWVMPVQSPGGDVVAEQAAAPPTAIAPALIYWPCCRDRCRPWDDRDVRNGALTCSMIAGTQDVGG